MSYILKETFRFCKNNTRIIKKKKKKQCLPCYSQHRTDMKYISHEHCTSGHCSKAAHTNGYQTMRYDRIKMFFLIDKILGFECKIMLARFVKWYDHIEKIRQKLVQAKND